MDWLLLGLNCFDKNVIKNVFIVVGLVSFIYLLNFSHLMSSGFKEPMNRMMSVLQQRMS